MDLEKGGCNATDIWDLFQGGCTASDAVWGGDVGGNAKDGAGAERVPTWGGKAAHWEAGA